MKQFEKALAKNGIYQKTDKHLIAQIEKAVRDWLAGKLIVGSEKANAYNEVILKLLHELDIQQEMERTKMSETKTKNKSKYKYYCSKRETNCKIKECYYNFKTQYAFNCYKKYCLWREKL